MNRVRFPVLASIAVAFTLAACEDRRGRVDPLRTGALGALIGAGVGLAGGAIADTGRDRAYRKPRYSRRQAGYDGYGYSHRPTYRPQGHGYRDRLPPVAYGNWHR